MSLGGGGFVQSTLQFPLTRRVAYTPTLSAGATNITANTAFWWRDNQHMFIDWQITFGGDGGTGADATITIPTGAIDTSVLCGGTDTSNKAASMVGQGYYFIQGAGWKFLYGSFATTTTLYFIENSQHLQWNQLHDGDGVRMTIRVPIVGW